MKQQQCIAKIVSNQSIHSDFFSMVVSCPEVATDCRPGQFVMFDTGENHVPYIKRPFAIADAQPDAGTLRFIYKVTGKGTRLMTQMPKGRTVSLIAPLGNGYTLPEAGSTVLLVAGGVGISSILSLLPLLVKLNCGCHVVIGARNQEGLLCLDEIEGMGVQLHISTEDGSVGYAGYPTAVVKRLLEENHFDASYICGPNPMMRSVAPEVVKAGVFCQVSLENRMGCGFGVCVGCSCKIWDPEKGVVHRRVCKDGPVFQAEEVVWDG